MLTAPKRYVSLQPARALPAIADGVDGQRTTYATYFKRATDVLLAISLLILLAPIIVCIAIIIVTIDGRPILFAQERPGLHCRPFRLYKFRTMRNVAADTADPLPDKQRLTRLGRWLRKSSVDELPQLWNVVIGDMSLIGPRPLLLRYLPYLTAEEQLRHSIRPGITGLAQVNGRNTASWDLRLSYDIKYARRVSAFLDIHILALTVARVVRRSNVVVDPCSIMQDLDVERGKARAA